MKHLLACILHTAAQNLDPDFCPPEMKPHPKKTIYIHAQCVTTLDICHEMAI